MKLRRKNIISNLYRVIFLLAFAMILVSIIAFARGYRIDFQNQTLMPTGILSVSSQPKAASIYVNDVLRGVTDTNLTLPPGKYKVEIKKDGYSSWKQEVTLRGEIVMSLDAILFPKNPTLSPLTSSGIVKAINVDQTGRVLLFVQNDDVEKDGIYIFESNQRALSFYPPLKPLVLLKNLPDQIKLAETNVYFSPDYARMILEYSVNELPRAYLISLNGENPELIDKTATPQSLANVWQLLDATPSKETVLEAWKQERNRDIRKILETFPKAIQKVASDSFEIVSFSPDETKMLYKSNVAMDLPLVLKNPLIGSNQATEERTLQVGRIYLYDKKEDKNLPLAELTAENIVKNPTPSPAIPPTLGNYNETTVLFDSNYQLPTVNHFIQWYPDSRHLVIMQEKEIVVMDYDGTNKRTVYSGPFEKTFFTVGSDGKLVILTNLNPQNNTYPDLYGVGIR